jgi:hypothetical protein
MCACVCACARTRMRACQAGDRTAEAAAAALKASTVPRRHAFCKQAAACTLPGVQDRLHGASPDVLHGDSCVRAARSRGWWLLSQSALLRSCPVLGCCLAACCASNGQNLCWSGLEATGDLTIASQLHEAAGQTQRCVMSCACCYEPGRRPVAGAMLRSGGWWVGNAVACWAQRLVFGTCSCLTVRNSVSKVWWR